MVISKDSAVVAGSQRALQLLTESIPVASISARGERLEEGARHFATALEACFDWDEAHLIASADYLVDKNRTTTAEKHPFKKHNKINWHAFGHRNLYTYSLDYRNINTDPNGYRNIQPDTFDYRNFNRHPFKYRDVHSNPIRH